MEQLDIYKEHVQKYRRLLMGIYTFDNVGAAFNSVEDKEVQELFIKAHKLDSSLMIEQTIHEKRTWFRTQRTVSYTLFNRCYLPDGSSTNEARLLALDSGDKATIKAYLYGLINGYNLKNNG